MHEIEKLEKRWLKYRIKKFILKTIYFLAMPVLLILGIFLYEKFSYQNINYTKTKKIEKKEVNLTKSKTKVQTKDKNSSTEKNELFLRVQTDFLQNLKTYEKKEKIETKPKKEEKVRTVKKKSINKKEEKHKIVIEKKKNKNFLGAVIKKFEKNPDPKLAIFLSETFYKDGKFDKSLKWAIKANELDSSNEKSWIIFAKASAKLGKKEQAVKALKAYISNYNRSFEARKLLEKIENGEFK